MAEISDWVRRVGQAKAFIDNGMCRVGPSLDAERAADCVLAGGASRAIALSDAVVQLCRRDHPAEALPVLRHLAETTVGMAWVARGAGEAEKRAEAVLKEIEESAWDSLWPGARLRERAGQAELAAADVDGVLGLAAEFTLGNRKSAPWSHIFKENQRPPAEAAAVLEATVRWMGHVLRALDARWKGSFPGAEAMW